MNSFSLSGPHNPLPHLLLALRALYPPRCVVHVGAGQGAGDLALWRQWPEVPRAVVIDADDTRLAWVPSQANAQRVHATVAASAGPHSYYRASNPQEDGLLPPDQLQPWWPQLSTLATDTRHTQTLDSLLASECADLQTTPAAPPSHWLLLDCLPAAPLLQGASTLLAHTSVVCARTSHQGEQALASTNQAAVCEALAPHGFVLLAQTETHHPALGYTLLARQPSTAQATTLASDTPAPEQPQAPQPQASQPVDSPRENRSDSRMESANVHSQLQTENDALRHRLALLQEELLRAEGQINLIKDLMLRDQEL